jgi:hypothetical protein
MVAVANLGSLVLLRASNSSKFLLSDKKQSLLPISTRQIVISAQVSTEIEGWAWDGTSKMRAVAKPFAERRSTCDRQRFAYRMSSAPCSAATADSRSIDWGLSEDAKHCWEILSACLPSSKLEIALPTDATEFIPDEASIFHELLRSEFFRRLRGTLPPENTN